MPIPRYDRTEQLQPGSINRAAGAPGEALASALEQFSSRMQDRADERAQEQGLLEGQAAGLQGNLGPQDPRTIRDRAFQQGALVAHQAAVQTDIRDSISRFQTEAPDDPDAFDAKVAGLAEGLLKDADPRMRPFIEQRLADYGGRAKMDVIQAQQVKLRKSAIADLDVGVQGLVEDATTAAYEGNVPMTEARRQELYALLGGGLQAGFIDQAKVTEISRKFERDVTSQEVVGNFDRLLREKGDAEAVAAIRRWQDIQPSEVGLTAEDHEGVTRQLIALKNRQDSLLADDRAKAAAGIRAEQVLRKDRVQRAIDDLQAGLPLSPEYSKAVAADLAYLRGAGALDPTDVVQAGLLGQDFNEALAIQRQVHTFTRMDPVQRSTQLNKLRAALGGGTVPGGGKLLQSLERADNQINAQLAQDPRGFLEGAGLVPATGLDFSSGEKLVQSLASRAAEPDVGRALTHQPTPMLNKAEAQQFAAMYQQADTQGKVQLLGLISAGTKDRAEATLKQLDADGYKDMALLGSMVAEGRGQLASEILLGQQVRGAQKGITPKPTEYQPDLEDAIGGALLDWPARRATYTDAILSKYAELKARAGDGTDVYQPQLLDQAVAQVMPTAEVNDRRVLIPAQATPDTFERWFDDLADADFQTAAGLPAEGGASLVKRRGRLVELSGGRYGISLESAVPGAPPRYLLNKSNQPFVLEYGKPGPRPLEPQSGRPNP